MCIHHISNNRIPQFFSLNNLKNQFFFLNIVDIIPSKVLKNKEER